MQFWGKLSLQTKIILGLVTAAMLIVAGLSISNYYSSKNNMIREGKQEILGKINELTVAVGAVHQITQGRVNSDIEIMKSEIEKLGTPKLNPDNPVSMTITNQITKATEKVSIPSLQYGDTKMNGDTKFVDHIRKLVGGGTVTIFQVLPGKLLRVSTNVLKLDGERATGTYIPKDSSVLQKVMSGATFRGKAYVVNAWYLTAYFPMKDANGKIVSVVYVGRKILNKQVQAIIKSAHVFNKGYAYIFNEKGVFVNHPDSKFVAEKKDLKSFGVDQEAFLDADNEVLSYKFKGDTKFTGVGVFDKNLNWRIGLALSENELFSHLGARIIKHVLIGGVVALIVALLFAWAISRGAMKPINALGAAAKGVSEGKYDLDIPYEANDVMGQTIDNFKKMVITLQEKMQEAETRGVEATEAATRASKALQDAHEAREGAELAKTEGMHHAADTLKEVVDTVENITKELAQLIDVAHQGAETQRARTDESATATGQMNATVLEVAQSASSAAENADETKQEAQSGAEVVSNSIKAITTVQSLAMDLKENMSHLTTQAEAIGQVMNVINDIADQTNLLALNAAIEAARAGEAGRGFAVVADEVRKLAEKTLGATKEVGDNINQIQNSARKNNESVDEAVSAVEDATSLAQQSGDALMKIVNLAESTADQVRSIATASEEQSAASEEISRSIEEVSRITLESAESMGQASAQVHTLEEQAEELIQMVDEMKKS